MYFFIEIIFFYHVGEVIYQQYLFRIFRKIMWNCNKMNLNHSVYSTIVFQIQFSIISFYTAKSFISDRVRNNNLQQFARIFNNIFIYLFVGEKERERENVKERECCYISSKRVARIRGTRWICWRTNFVYYCCSGYRLLREERQYPRAQIIRNLRRSFLTSRESWAIKIARLWKILKNYGEEYINFPECAERVSRARSLPPLRFIQGVAKFIEPSFNLSKDLKSTLFFQSKFVAPVTIIREFLISCIRPFFWSIQDMRDSFEDSVCFISTKNWWFWGIFVGEIDLYFWCLYK